MTQTQTRVQLFLNGTCFDQYHTSASKIIAGQVREHLDAGWIVSDTRRFRLHNQSSFHVYFVRPHDGTSTATLVVRFPQQAPCEVCNNPAGSRCHTCWMQENAAFNTTPTIHTPREDAPAPEEEVVCAHNVLVGECDDCEVWHSEMIDCTPDEEDPTIDFSDIPMPEVTIDSSAFRAFVDRVEKSFLVAAIALTLSVTTTHAAPDLTACYPAGTTGEGFPVVHCPLTDSTYYIDLDGSDGTLGHQDDGRWIELP